MEKNQSDAGDLIVECLKELVASGDLTKTEAQELAAKRGRQFKE